MIIETEEVTENGVTFNQLTYDKPFYALAYFEDTKEVFLLTPENQPLHGKDKAGSLDQGLGGTDRDELIAEGLKRGLIF